jgi:peptidoglycan/LPS O-acetylase OafA/YrhL
VAAVTDRRRPARASHRLLRGSARVLAAAGLAVNAYVHADLASGYDQVAASVSQGDLFRLEAALGALAALLVLVWRRLPADLFAFVVAAGGLALLLVYLYVDVGEFGPFPDMYEPEWYAEKTLAAVAQAVAVVAAVLLVLTTRRRRPGRDEAPVVH